MSPTRPGPKRGLSLSRGARLDSLEERVCCVEIPCGFGLFPLKKEGWFENKFSLRVPAEADGLVLLVSPEAKRSAFFRRATGVGAHAESKVCSNVSSRNGTRIYYVAGMVTFAMDSLPGSALVLQLHARRVEYSNRFQIRFHVG